MPSPDSNPAPTRRPWLPWGLLAALAAVAGEVLIVLRVVASEATPWPGVLAVLGIAVAVLLTVGWLTHYLWGLTAALLVAIHPVFAQAATNPEGLLLAPVLELAVVAASVAGWRLLRQPAFSLLRAMLWAGALLATLTLLWPLKPESGLVASAAVVIGLNMACGFALRLRRGSAPMLLLSNIIFVGLSAWLIPAGSYLLASHSAAIDFLPWQSATRSRDGDLEELIRAAVARTPLDAAAPTSTWTLSAKMWADRDRWAWPLDWVVLPLLAYGLWRSLRRGLRERARGQLPITWILPLVALLTVMRLVLLRPDPATMPALLSALTLVLAVFALADVTRGIGERLVLAPPTDSVQHEPVRIAGR